MNRVKKVTDQQIIDSYNKHQNVWKAAEELGICGQSVYERAIKLGIQKKRNVFTEDDFFFLKENYNEYLYKGKLQDLADKMGRTKQFICRKAKQIGLTDIKRKKSVIEGYKPRKPNWSFQNHPRGMKGKKHTQKTLDIISKKSKEVWSNMSEDRMSSKIIKMLAQITVQQNTGNLNKVMPGARIFRMVTKKLIPDSKLPTPEICTAQI